MTVQDDKTRKKIRWLRAGFVVLVLVVGLAPLLLLISYTRDINLIEFLHRRPEQRVERAPEEPPAEPYMVQYLYRVCDHSSVHDPRRIPPDGELPPADLLEVAVALHESDNGIENIVPYFESSGWYVAELKADSGGPLFTFTHLDDLCPDCREKYYLGIFSDGSTGYIALFEGRPPDGKLIRLTHHEVRDDDREQLEAGVILDSPDDLESALEAYTS